MLRDALSRLKALSGNDPTRESPTTGVAMHHLANVLRQEKSYSEARTLAEACITLYQQHPDWPDNERRHAQAVLDSVLKDQNNPPRPQTH